MTQRNRGLLIYQHDAPVLKLHAMMKQVKACLEIGLRIGVEQHRFEFRRVLLFFLLVIPVVLLRF